MIVAFGLVLMTNTLTIQLAVIAGFLATLYPFTKRWTHLPQFVLDGA
jgi:4-hydroxybenzoate polyprenyltransferase